MCAPGRSGRALHHNSIVEMEATILLHTSGTYRPGTSGRRRKDDGFLSDVDLAVKIDRGQAS